MLCVATAAQQIFIKSALPTTVLASVWNLCAVNGGNALSFPEFALGMFLAKLALGGSPLPPQLPQDVRSQVTLSIAEIQAAATAAAASTTVAVASSIGPINSQFSQTASSSVSATPLGSPMPAAVGLGIGMRSLTPDLQMQYQQQQQQQQQQRAWAIGPAEKAQYDATFRTWDPSNSGFISGDRARQIFAQSGLPENILAHIWSLADGQSLGKLNADEFAVAMHLIYKKLNGHDVPRVLPPELVPPSTRDLNALTVLAKSEAMRQEPMRRISPSASLMGFTSETSLYAASQQASSLASAADHLRASESAKRDSILSRVEQKRKQLAELREHIDSDNKQCTDIEIRLRALKTQSIVAQENIIDLSRTKQTLAPSTSLGSASPLSDMEIAEFERIEHQTLALIDECKQRQIEVADLQTAAIRARHAKQSSQSSMTASSNAAADVADKAAALLAARMAMLGVPSNSLPQRSISPSPSISSNLNIHDEIAAVDRDKFNRLQELNEIRNRVTIFSSQIRSAISIQKASLGLPAAGRWEPSVADRVKFEEGVGLETREAIALVVAIKVI
eukprot:jgi/Hompol1/6701/HPOL_000303-RA